MLITCILISLDFSYMHSVVLSGKLLSWCLPAIAVSDLEIHFGGTMRKFRHQDEYI